MIKITISKGDKLSDVNYTAVLEAVTNNMGYQTKIKVPGENNVYVEIDNPQTRKNFLLEKVKNFILNHYKSYTVNSFVEETKKTKIQDVENFISTNS